MESIIVIVKYLVLGIVQGFTEWLPVSSSAHLAITDRIFQINAGLGVFVLMHLATLLSLVLFFRKRIIAYFYDENAGNMLHASKKGFYVLIAVIPIFIAGLLFHDAIEAVFTDFFYIGIFLVINSLILLSTKYFNGKQDIGLWSTIIIGVSQVFALLPGISRSGVTISAGLISKVRKEDAFMFSMMLSIPAIAGAFFYELLSSGIIFDIASLLAFAAATLTGYLALHILSKKIMKGEFYSYWSYCLIIGIIMLFN